jgi:hypothetical protein
MLNNLQNSEAPTVTETAHRAPSGIWSLIVDCCPHCGKRHLHGGGGGATPEGGHRAAHCYAGRGYVLVLEQQE